MALRDGDKTNFETLCKAIMAGQCALVQSTDKATGEYRALLVAMNRHGDETEMVPLAQMVVGNPYDDYTDPIADMEKESVQ